MPVPRSPVLPRPLDSATLISEETTETLGSEDGLDAFLRKYGIDTSVWGKGNLKTVHAFWEELEGQESGLQLWQGSNSEFYAVRTTHVLRAKVCSPESYTNDVFLFNTWQQFGDGRTRVRNGLLSEKLSMDELPLVDHLDQVCARAVTEEEMQRVVEAAMEITSTSVAPKYDPTYKCPLTVTEAKLISHTTELEASKSYEGLLTLYHLYTVDIICTGLPPVNFNTLEFAHADKNGYRKLKYIHAWVWLEWSQIQRYLLEGSKLVARHQQDSFQSAFELENWLSQFGELRLDTWGLHGTGTVEDLFVELQSNKTCLEHWGREDGVDILMRVVHVLQLKVGSDDARLKNKFLFHAWQKRSDGKTKSINKLFARKMPLSGMPFSMGVFETEAERAIDELLSNQVDVHIRLNSDKQIPTTDKLELSFVSTRFVEHRVDIEESPSFKNMFTAYHLYTMEVQLAGLPVADFAAMEQPSGSRDDTMTRTPTRCTSSSSVFGGVKVNGWQWVTWQQIVDKLSGQSQRLARKCELQKEHMMTLRSQIAEMQKRLAQEQVDGPAAQLATLLGEVDKYNEEDNQVCEQLCRKLPPSMVSQLAHSKTMILDDVAEAVNNVGQVAKEASPTNWLSALFCSSCRGSHTSDMTVDISGKGLPASVRMS